MPDRIATTTTPGGKQGYLCDAQPGFQIDKVLQDDGITARYTWVRRVEVDAEASTLATTDELRAIADPTNSVALSDQPKAFSPADLSFILQSQPSSSARHLYVDADTTVVSGTSYISDQTITYSPPAELEAGNSITIWNTAIRGSGITQTFNAPVKLAVDNVEIPAVPISAGFRYTLAWDGADWRIVNDGSVTLTLDDSHNGELLTGSTTYVASINSPNVRFRVNQIPVGNIDIIIGGLSTHDFVIETDGGAQTIRYVNDSGTVVVNKEITVGGQEKNRGDIIRLRGTILNSLAGSRWQYFRQPAIPESGTFANYLEWNESIAWTGAADQFTITQTQKPLGEDIRLNSAHFSVAAGAGQSFALSKGTHRVRFYVSGHTTGNMNFGFLGTPGNEIFSRIFDITTGVLTASANTSNAGTSTITVEDWQDFGEGLYRFDLVLELAELGDFYMAAYPADAADAANPVTPFEMDAIIYLANPSFASSARSLYGVLHSDFSQSISLSTATKQIDFGIQLQELDKITLFHAYGTLSESSTETIFVRAGQPDRFAPWPRINEVIDLSFPDPLSTWADIRIVTSGGNLNSRIIGWQIERAEPAAYGIPSANVLIVNEVTITVTLDGVPATLFSTGTDTISVREGVVGQRLRIALPNGKLLASLTASTGVSASVVGIQEGRIEVYVPPATGNATIDATTSEKNSYYTLIASATGLPPGTVPVAGGFTFRELFGEIQNGEYIPGEYSALWLVMSEGSADGRFWGKTIPSKMYVQQNYGELYAGGHSSQYLILNQGSADATSWTARGEDTPNSTVHIYGLRDGIALPPGYNAPALRTVTLDPTGSVTQFANGEISEQFLEGVPSPAYLALSNGRRLSATINPTISSGNVRVSSYSAGSLLISAGTNDATLKVEEEPFPAQSFHTFGIYRTNGDGATASDPLESPIQNVRPGARCCVNVSGLWYHTGKAWGAVTLSVYASNDVLLAGNIDAEASATVETYRYETYVAYLTPDASVQSKRGAFPTLFSPEFEVPADGQFKVKLSFNGSGVSTVGGSNAIAFLN